MATLVNQLYLVQGAIQGAFLQVGTGFGTRVWPVVVSIVLVLGFTTFVFTDARNVVASHAYLQTFTEKELNEIRDNKKELDESPHKNLAETWGVVTFAYPSKYATPSAGQENDPVRVPDVTPTDIDAQWNWFDGFALAIRLTVRLIGVPMSENWEPAREKVFLFDEQWFVHANMLARVATWISWILWPLFIYGVAGVFQRRADRS